jgi:hypothetical protein
LSHCFVERLREAREAIKPSDPWTSALRNIRGQIGHDGVERIATDAVFEQLDIPRLQRTPEAAKRNVSTILRQPSVEFKLGCLAFSAVD